MSGRAICTGGRFSHSFKGGSFESRIAGEIGNVPAIGNDSALSHTVPDFSAAPGGCAVERFDRGGEVVGLGLQGDYGLFPVHPEE